LTGDSSEDVAQVTPAYRTPTGRKRRGPPQDTQRPRTRRRQSRVTYYPPDEDMWAIIDEVVGKVRDLSREIQEMLKETEENLKETEENLKEIRGKVREFEQNIRF
jgi:hypothetical protein